MYAGKRCNSRSNLTKRYKLDRVAPVDSRPPPRIRTLARNRCEPDNQIVTTVTLSYCQAVILSDCLTFRLADCLTVRLPVCETGWLGVAIQPPSMLTSLTPIFHRFYQCRFQSYLAVCENIAFTRFPSIMGLNRNMLKCWRSKVFEITQMGKVVQHHENIWDSLPY